MAVRRKIEYKTPDILLKVSRMISSSLDIDTVSDLILRESARALKADHSSLFLMDEDSRRLDLFKAIGFSEDEIANIKILGSWEVINDQVVKKKRSLVVNDIHSNRIFKKKHLPFSMEKLPVKSFIALPLKKNGDIVGVLIVSNTNRPGHRFSREDCRLLTALSNNIAIALLNAKLYRNLKELFINTVRSLVRAVDAKDPYTSGHSERVMKYSLAIGRELKLRDEARENLGLSSLLHDVGKIGIRESVLDKPGRLSAKERYQIVRHPSIGVKIVETIGYPNRIIRGILEHHERMDGAGYPNHLKGKAISMEGRIIALSDAYDAITTDRPYHKAFTPKEAVFEILKNSPGQFDPMVVKAFASSFSHHPEVWKT